MNEHLVYVLTSDINVFYFFRNYVLSLGQLENVFLPVYDLQRSVLKYSGRGYFSIVNHNAIMYHNAEIELLKLHLCIQPNQLSPFQL